MGNQAFIVTRMAEFIVAFPEEHFSTFRRAFAQEFGFDDVKSGTSFRIVDVHHTSVSERGYLYVQVSVPEDSKSRFNDFFGEFFNDRDAQFVNLVE